MCWTEGERKKEFTENVEKYLRTFYEPAEADKKGLLTPSDSLTSDDLSTALMYSPSGIVQSSSVGRQQSMVRVVLRSHIASTLTTDSLREAYGVTPCSQHETAMCRRHFWIDVS